MLVLVLAAGCCGSPRPCTKVASGGAPANEPAAQAAPAPQAEATRRWEPGPPVDTHIAGWSCAMPGPGREDEARAHIEALSTLVGHVATGPGSTQEKIEVKLLPGAALRIGDVILVIRETVWIAGGTVQSIEGSHAVVGDPVWMERARIEWPGAEARRMHTRK